MEDASNFNELVSKRDGPVSFLQMQPFPVKDDGCEGFRKLHPFLLVVAGEDTNTLAPCQNRSHLGGVRDGMMDSQSGNCVNSPTAVRFYSFQSHCYEHVLRFRSSVCMVRCSPRIVAVGLATQVSVDLHSFWNFILFKILIYIIVKLPSRALAQIVHGQG